MKLKDYMVVHGVGLTEMARLLGVSEVAVSRYRQGARRPSPDVMRRIIRVTKGAVTPNDFYDLENSKMAAPAETPQRRRAGGG